MSPIMSKSLFGARTSVTCWLALVGLALFLQLAAGQQQLQDGCKMECYPNTRVINGKGGVGKGDNCRWILRTDGKPARLCDHIKCRKVCPLQSNAAANQQDQQEAAASSGDLRIEQKLEGESAASSQVDGLPMAAMGVMRQMHGNKLAKAPVPGVASGRLSSQPQQPQQPQQQQQQVAGRRMAPTLPPSVQYDENDTPPPISRFLDISPEE